MCFWKLQELTSNHDCRLFALKRVQKFCEARSLVVTSNASCMKDLIEYALMVLASSKLGNPSLR